jgi:hypothetical protein
MVGVLLKVTAAAHRTTTRRAPLVICHFTPPAVSPAMIRRWKINTTIPQRQKIVGTKGRSGVLAQHSLLGRL